MSHPDLEARVFALEEGESYTFSIKPETDRIRLWQTMCRLSNAAKRRGRDICIEYEDDKIVVYRRRCQNKPQAKRISDLPFMGKLKWGFGVLLIIGGSLSIVFLSLLVGKLTRSFLPAAIPLVMGALLIGYGYTFMRYGLNTYPISNKNRREQ